MRVEVKVPQLPESVTEATLVSWHRKVGEAVARDENLVDLETDKVVLEVPAPAAGVIKELKVQNGATVTSGQVLALREEEFVQAARALGAGPVRIIFRHIIPNGLAPIFVHASLALGGVIVLESALSFLGLGVQDPTPTWGNMLDFARAYMFKHPWLPLVPGIPLVIVAMGFNFIGDGLRDALDPRLKR